MPGPKKEILIEWDTIEQERSKELVKDIKKRSGNLASRIKDKVKENLNHIKLNPKIFEADEFKESNDGSFRKFTAIHIRVVYKLTPIKSSWYA